MANSVLAILFGFSSYLLASSNGPSKLQMRFCDKLKDKTETSCSFRPVSGCFIRVIKYEDFVSLADCPPKGWVYPSTTCTGCKSYSELVTKTPVNCNTTPPDNDCTKASPIGPATSTPDPKSYYCAEGCRE